MAINSKQVNFINRASRVARQLLDAMNTAEGFDRENTQGSPMNDPTFTDATIQELRPDLTEAELTSLFVTIQAIKALRDAGHGTNLSAVSGD